MSVIRRCKRYLAIWLTLGGFAFALSSILNAADTNMDESSDEAAPVAGKLENLKKQVIDLNRDLFILEEDLLYPASTQIAVFLSVDTGKFLRLDSAKIKIDGEVVAAHLYTETQIRALQRGGMQRIYVGNLKTGNHELTAFVEGMGPDNREYKKAATVKVKKETDLKSLEIRISDASSNFEPDVRILEWE